MSFIDTPQVHELRQQLHCNGWQTRVVWELGPGGKGGQVTLVAERDNKLATCSCSFGNNVCGGVPTDGLRAWMVLGWRVVIELAQCE